MPTTIEITEQGQTLVRVTYDVGAKTLQCHTSTGTDTARLIGIAIEQLAKGDNKPYARAQVEQLHTIGAPVDDFARALMNLVREQFANMGDVPSVQIEITTAPTPPAPASPPRSPN